MKDIIIVAWTDYLHRNLRTSDPDSVARAFKKASEEKSHIEAHTILKFYNELEERKKLRNENSGEYIVRNYKSYFCRWCLTVQPHDFYFGKYICHVCNQDYDLDCAMCIKRYVNAFKIPKRGPFTMEYAMNYLHERLGMNL